MLKCRGDNPESKGCDDSGVWCATEQGDGCLVQRSSAGTSDACIKSVLQAQEPSVQGESAL